jgi:hypothetical protein
VTDSSGAPGTVIAGLYAPADTTDENQSKQLSELRRYASVRGWEVLESEAAQQEKIKRAAEQVTAGAASPNGFGQVDYLRVG